ASSSASSLHGYGARPDLHSFPTRRPSDLRGTDLTDEELTADLAAALLPIRQEIDDLEGVTGVIDPFLAPQGPERVDDAGDTLERSEEHTSELQSRENLVCRLLLEKKNKTQ